MRHWTEDQRRESARAFLSSVVAVEKRAETPQQSSSMPATSMNLLVKTALEPGTFLLDMYRALGLHAAEGKAAQEDLVARGYVRLHRLVRKGRGGQPQVLEVTREGTSLLASRGISVAPRLLKGGFKHDCYARIFARWAAKSSMRCTFERTLGAKCFDIVYEDGGGDLHGVEICLSGSPSWNAQQLVKAAGVAGVGEVVALCEVAALAKSIAQALASIDQLGLYKDRLRLALLGEFMD